MFGIRKRKGKQQFPHRPRADWNPGQTSRDNFIGGIKLSYEVFTIQPLMRNLLTVTGQAECILTESSMGINWDNPYWDRPPERFHQLLSFVSYNFCLESAKSCPPSKKRKKPSINRLMKYENVYGPFNLPNCSSIIHLSDIQLYQQEFISELPLFLRRLHYICLVRYSLYIYFTSEEPTR